MFALSLASLFRFTSATVRSFTIGLDGSLYMPVVLLAKSTMKIQTLLKKFVCTEFEFHPDAASQPACMPGGLAEGQTEGGVGVGGGGLAATTASSSSATPGIRGKDVVPQSPAMMAMNDRRARMRQAVNENMATAKPDKKRKALMKLMDIEETVLLAEKQLEEDLFINKEQMKGKAQQKEKVRRNSLVSHQGATGSFINFLEKKKGSESGGGRKNA